MFDLDGVLRNTEPYHRMAYAQLARSLSGGAPPDAGEIAGKSNLQLYEALVARFGGPATAEELSQRHFRLVCQLLEEYRPAINTKGSGIGVRNVHQRIQLTFGRQYGLTIQSEPDEGTLVRIHLPALDEEASRPYRKEAGS